MARPHVFTDPAYVGCLVNGSMAHDVRLIATRRGVKASDVIRDALAAAISADLIAQLSERRSAA